MTVESVVLSRYQDGPKWAEPDYDVVVLATTSSKADPGLSLRTGFDGQVMWTDNHYIPGTLGGGLSVFEYLTTLPVEQWRPMAACLATGPLSARSTRSLQLWGLDTPMSHCFATLQSQANGFKQRLVDLAQRRGFAPGDTALIWYIDASKDYPLSYREELVGFDRLNRSWVLLATRVGGDMASFVETR